MGMMGAPLMPEEDRGSSGWDMFGQVAGLIGPALMARGFNMPALAMMGPQLMQLSQRRKEFEAKERERERKRRMTEYALQSLGGGGMMEPPPAAAAASPGRDMTAGTVGIPASMTPQPAGLPGASVAATSGPGDIMRRSAIETIAMGGDPAAALAGYRTYQAEAPEREREEFKQRFGQVKDLRGEFEKESKEFKDVTRSYQRILDAGRKPSAAGDLALIFNYMKMLDPGSTVREGEFATAQNAAGVPDQIRNMFNRVLSGERLGPDQRQDFIGRAGMLYDGQSDLFGQTYQRYSDLATGYGFKPERVVRDYRLGAGNGTPPASAAPPSRAPSPPPGSAVAAPAGATPTGRMTKDGRPVYQMPDGSLVAPVR